MSVRCHATLLFGALLPLVPTTAEPHQSAVLHGPLAAHASVERDAGGGGGGGGGRGGGGRDAGGGAGGE
eukprot:5704733-Prymnesium_polylepis.1